MAHLSDEERNRVAKLYESRIDEHGLNVAALKSGGVGKQWVRHSVHAEAFELTGLHVLDVGCGIAMFYRYLKCRGIAVASYTGIDIVEPFLKNNRAAYPDAQFLSMDIFTDSLDQLSVDVVYISQVFNNKYANTDNELVARAAIKRLFDIARAGLVIDFMSTYVDWRDTDLHYFNPEAMFGFGKSLTQFVELRHDYLPFEHTLILRKAPRYAVPEESLAQKAYAL